MIGDESGLREAVMIKEQNKLKKRMKIAQMDPGIMKRLSKEHDLMLNSIIKPGILEHVVPSIGANTMKGAGGLTTLSEASGAPKISTSNSQFSKMQFGAKMKIKDEIKKEKEITNQRYEHMCYEATKRVQNN